ncbi:ubiquitin-activating enzyme, putative [Babesia bigemina]|uniref:SUMO-activating enzyme subunit n=1 Tax=Babesia bigemina TaxID=5866 RepID=A0A061DAR1_BABBI|nr:ubiquitin-activating enzyme, putative [Babesia bigemina]CDR97771.1 ubiquitin-activating enzyme, putative [Babesia bigemina]|eukprot:XP_012769957.1 ubiquitin-activating enzyme, putative [Babesia bigemina]
MSVQAEEIADGRKESVPNHAGLDSLGDPDEYIKVLQDVSVLVVGAGGVGCEVIKNLILCGLRKLVIVDLDTIDISNLNRQFLYKRQHVKRYKAEVACERAREAAPGCDISAMVVDVLTWRPQDVACYDAVLNALDNVRARSHINYCCMHAGVPLIESGSSGFNGQVYPILRGVTPCYDCHAKPRSKSYPVCTIRQIPEKPEHCIAWARQLYELIFGAKDNGNILSDLAIPPMPVGEGVKVEQARSWVRDVFTFLFDTQIAELIDLKDRWTGRQAPQCINYPFTSGDADAAGNSVEEKLPENLEDEDEAADVSKRGRVENSTHSSDDDSPQAKSRKIYAHTVESQSDALSEPISPNVAKQNQQEMKIADKFRTCDTNELAEQFISSVMQLLLDRPDDLGRAVFDKDDPLCIQFVAAAANLRMINFHIPQVSAWDVQSIAGAIIPAIAATNAIVAAAQVMQLVHLLHARRAGGGTISRETLEASRCRFVWVKSCVTGSTPLKKGALCSPDVLDMPNASCTVCQQQLARVELHSLEHWTLAKFASRICNERMGMEAVSIDVDGRNILDPDFMEEDETYAKRIREWTMLQHGLQHQSILTLTSSVSGKQLELQLLVEPSVSSDDFVLSGFD